MRTLASQYKLHQVLDFVIAIANADSKCKRTLKALKECNSENQIHSRTFSGGSILTATSTRVHFTHHCEQTISSLNFKHVFTILYLDLREFQLLLPPANEVWDKVICLHLSVCHSVHRGGPGPGGLPGPWGGAWSRGVWSGGCLVETPLPDGYCCGRYASYWNAFLFI